MATFAEMKSLVRGFMGSRASTDFVFESLDAAGYAVNHARRYAERRHDFEFARVRAYLDNVNLSTGVDLSTALLEADDSSVDVKLIEGVWLETSGGGRIPIDFQSRSNVREQLYRIHQRAQNTRDTIPATTGLELITASLHGTTLFLNPKDTSRYGNDTTPRLFIDAVRWLPQYSDDADTDELLQYGEDFILYRSIEELNYWQKEDARVAISAAVMQDAWDSVLAWDARRANNSRAVTLD